MAWEVEFITHKEVYKTWRRLSVSIHVHLNGSRSFKYHIQLQPVQKRTSEVCEHAICIRYLICVIAMDGFIGKREN